MKKNFRLVLALVLSIMMVLGSMSALAADPVTVPSTPKTPNQVHKITINNIDQNTPHTYKAYQVFIGDLNDVEDTLSNIKWGAGINHAGLVNYLKTTAKADIVAKYEGLGAIKDAVDAAFTENASATDDDIARVIANAIEANSTNFTSTDAQNKNTSATDNFAELLEAYKTGDGNAFTEKANNRGFYEATVLGDGYYMILDETTTLSGTKQDGTEYADTKSKIMLTVVKNITVTAKDTGTTSNKEITGDGPQGTDTPEDSSADTASIGDLIEYKVTLNNVPDPIKYNEFKLFMVDTMEPGLTFHSIDSVVLSNGTTAQDVTLANGTNYTLYIDENAETTTTYDDITIDANKWDTAKVTARSGETKEEAVETNATNKYTKMKFVIRNAKTLIEGNRQDGEDSQYAGGTLTITYKAYVNKYATYGEDSNDNDSHFVISNNPNVDYDGNTDTFDQDEPKGETPDSKVRTFVTTLELLKYDGDTASGNTKTGLPGAKFAITATDEYNVTLETGVRYITKAAYDADVAAHASDDTVVIPDVQKVVKNGQEEIVKYWLLKDGSYSDQDPNEKQDDGVTLKYNQDQYEDINTVYYRESYATEYHDHVTDQKAVIISGANGIATLKGLKPGTYTITEVVAPDGYNLLTEQLVVHVTWDKDNYLAALAKAPSARSTEEAALVAAGGFKLTTDDNTAGWTLDNDGHRYYLEVANFSGAVLPSTGGIGTTIFYVAGSILVLAAAILLITKRRMGAND